MELLQGDCIEKMKKIHDRSVDMILTDLPYNVTDCKWDKEVINLEILEREYLRTTDALVA